MKKINLLFYAFALFALFACQQDDLDTTLGTSVSTPKTRGVGGYYYENELPVYKLLGLPVYIINRGNGNSNGAYLTANSNYTVTLEAKNPNRNQRWIIDPYDKTVNAEAGGSDDNDVDVQYGVYSFDMTGARKYLGLSAPKVSTPSLIYKDNIPKSQQWRFFSRRSPYEEVWYPNGYMEIYKEWFSGSYYNQYYESGYLVGSGSTISLSGYVDTELWEIQPAENFRLDKLTWSLDAEDVIKTLPAFMDQVEIKNNSAAEANMTATFNRKASETSTFTKSVGSQVQVHTTAKVGVPLIVSAKIDITNTTSANWQWGSSETHEDTRTYSFNVKVPPYTSVTAKIMVQLSQLSASYTADFVGEVSGKSLRISGKWEGVEAGNIYYEIVDNKTRNVMKSFSGIPQSTIILNK